MRSLLITHFYNEELLLPHWIAHHKDMFDDVILINFGSTDRSVEIIGREAPNWTIVPSRTESFDAQSLDEQVMEIERTFTGWKFTLTTTEFLSRPIQEAIRECEEANLSSMNIPSVLLIDRRPDVVLREGVAPFIQKPWGIRGSYWRRLFSAFVRLHSLRLWPDKFPEILALSRYSPLIRGRLLHRNSTGSYRPGRHSWEGFASTPRSKKVEIAWLGLSPWSAEFLERKMQIGPRVSARDRARGYAGQHLQSRVELDRIHRLLSTFSVRCFR